jgi:CHAD domain-containing protein
VKRGATGAADETVPKVLAARCARLIRERRRVKTGRTARAVHDLRVASRRLQAALDLFDPFLPAGPRRRLDRRARAMRRAFGTVRNAEVMLALLRELGRGLSPGALRALRALRREWLGRAALPGAAAPGIRRRARAFLAGVPRITREALLRRARMALAAHARRVAAAAGSAGTGSTEALHRLRIALKRQRYAMETLRDCGVAGLSRPIGRIRRLQSVLGRLHDLDLLRESINGRVGAGLAPLARRLDVERVRLARRAAPAILRVRAAPAPFPPRGRRSP